MHLRLSILLNMCVVCLQLSQIIKLKNEALDISKHAIFFVMIVIYITLANYAGQEFINSDSDFYRTMYIVQFNIFTILNVISKLYAVRIFIVFNFLFCNYIDVIHDGMMPH